MRDDIHKRVPRPPAIQRWVRFSVNDADRLASRPFEALQDALHDTCKRELSQSFVRELQRELQKAPELFGPLANVLTPRDLGGRGGHLEMEVLTECKRLLAQGTSHEFAARNAIEVVMSTRSLADIRVTQAVVPRGDAKAPIVLASMRSDVGKIDFRAFADSVCSGSAYEPRQRARSALDLDSDMLGISGRGRS